jgi:hypothetical protein
MSRRPERSRRDPVLLGCIAVVLAPFLVGLGRVLFGHWTPVGDWALLELRARSVGGSHSPLVGAYSRFGWSHPGPALFYVLAIPCRLLGRRPDGLLVGALLVNAASVAGIVLLAWRRGRRPLAVGTSIALIVLCRALGAGFLRDPWNPFITVLPLALLVFLAWSIACGDMWMLPIAVLVASFIVQSHVGYAALVVVALGVAVAWRTVALVHARGSRAEPRHRRTAPIVGVTAAVTLVAWAPPLVDQRHGGNLRAIYDFFRTPHDSPSTDTAARVVGRALTVPGAWVTGNESVRTSDFTVATAGVFVPLALVALVGAVVVAARRRDRDALALLCVITALLTAAVYSISHIVGPLAAYLVRWLLVLAMVTWVAAAWTVWPVVRSIAAGHTARRSLALVALAVAVVPTVMSVDDAVREHGPWHRVGLVERRLARDAVAHLTRDGRPVLLESKDERWFTWGLAPRLEAAGIPVAARRSDALFYGGHRVSRGGEARRKVVVVTGVGARTTRRPAGGRLIAWYPGRRRTAPPLPAVAGYRAVVPASEQDLLALEVAVYEVVLEPGSHQG